MQATLKDLLATGANDAPAISAPSRSPLSFGALRQLIDDTLAQLNALGIGRNDRVAIVLPNGPEMATCFMACARGVASAPLNPAYRADEFQFYLSDLNAKALIVEQGSHSPAIEVAQQLGVRLIDLLPQPEQGAGSFTLQPREARADAPAVHGGDAQPDDVSMVLHTSGTTSRPKIVPLSQANLHASAGNIRASLALTAADRCLNVMPLFHIHGLIAAVSASLSAGGSIWCAPGFDALRFFGWMKAAAPTWYTAVPTMHQAILLRAARNRDVIGAAPLRFLRSSSASLPGQVMEALGETFAAPVIEAYGMTEATHQMASNPLPPRAQKPGSVGIAAGPQLRIAHELENRLIDGVGEVVICGPNVTGGYESNPEANEKNFFTLNAERWFRTGDQGKLDAEGYLRLTGRLKEIINRGGEKISPLEVDGVLMDHPAVQQVVTFAIAHPKLGEEVGAAVVLRDGHSATEQEIRSFAATRMADFKVPRRIVILDDIPKGATGKLQRIGLAEKLGLGAAD
jgi:acyl-CoA synthetase (AMP-forming)/AMP-acid ligase II